MVVLTKIKEEEKADTYLDEKLRERESERLNKVMPFAVAAIAGFCLSQVDVLSDMSPFTHAFAAVVPFGYCPGAFIGGVIGYLSAFSFGLTVRYILSLCFICLVRLLIHKRLRFVNTDKAGVAVSFIAVTGAAVIHQLFTEVTFIGVVLAMLEGAIALCSSYFFSRSFRTPVSRMGLFNLPMGDKLSIGISVFVFVMCFSGLRPEGFSPARLVCCFVICFASYCNGAALGSVAGVCLGAALCIDPEGRFVFPAFAVAGLISGAFAPMGQIAVGVACCMSFCVCCVIGGLDEMFWLPMIECAVASAAFMLVPSEKLSGAVEYVRKNGVVKDDIVNLQVASILKRASGNIYSFCKTVDDVSERLDRVINPEVNKLFFEIQQNVCDGCSRKSACWSLDFDATAGDILVIMGLEKRGKSRLELEKNCSRLHELKNQIAKGKAQYSMSMLSKTKNREMRRLLTEQFSGVGDFLGELSLKIEKSRTVDSLKSMALRSVVIDSGVYIDSLSCFSCDEGRLGIEISCFEQPFETDYKAIKQILEDVTGHIFDEPDISVTDMGTFIRFEERAPYCLIVGTAQRPFVKDAPCGDSVAWCKRSDASSAVLLSDGMGTGSSAALDSSMAVTLMQKLVGGGFSFESAVKLVNSSLIMKSTDESMATLDGLCVNLYTGEAEFYKAGAAISLIRCDREIFAVEESSLPLGILREVSFAKTAVSLKAGDIVLLVSDGITAGDCGWINDELLSWSTNNMEDLAGHIVQLAALRQDRLTGDDLTAVAVKLVERR